MNAPEAIDFFFNERKLYLACQAIMSTFFDAFDFDFLPRTANPIVVVYEFFENFSRNQLRAQNSLDIPREQMNNPQFVTKSVKDGVAPSVTFRSPSALIYALSTDVLTQDSKYFLLKCGSHLISRRKKNFDARKAVILKAHPITMCGSSSIRYDELVYSITKPNGPEEVLSSFLSHTGNNFVRSRMSIARTCGFEHCFAPDHLMMQSETEAQERVLFDDSSKATEECDHEPKCIFSGDTKLLGRQMPKHLKYTKKKNRNAHKISSSEEEAFVESIREIRNEIAPFQCAVCYKLFQEFRLYNLHLKKRHFMSGMKKEKKCSKEDKQKRSQQKQVQKISLPDIVPGSLGDKVPIRKPSNKGISSLHHSSSFDSMLPIDYRVKEEFTPI